MKKLLGMTMAAAVLLVVGAANAAQPLVDASWVKANIGKAGVSFVDLRPEADYVRGHVPGAVHTNYGKDGWRVKDANGTPGMLGDPQKIGALIGRLGIDNNTHVVLLPVGKSSSDMGAATRLFWTFKVLGHDNVSILNGGMAAYGKMDPATKKPMNPMEKGAVQVAAKTFNVNLRSDMIATKEDVSKAMSSGVALVDLRPNDQFVGVNQHPAAKRKGTIPGAKNLPNNWMTVNGKGMFRDKDQIEKLYMAANVSTTGEQINFCNSGHWASVGWFTAHELLGNENAKLYDGSMIEWSKDASKPMEAAVKLQ